MTQAFHYEGFSSPNGTIVPDDVFDLLAPRLSEAELRVLLYIIRRTFGFKKDSDTISLKQMVEGITKRDGTVIDHGAGVVKSAAARAVRGLVEKGVVIATRNRSAEKGDEPTSYQLRFRVEPVFSKRTRGVPPKGQGGVLLENPQQTVLQATVRQQTGKESHPHTLDEILLSNIRNGRTNILETRDEELSPKPTAATFVPPHSSTNLTSPGDTSPAPRRGFQTPATVLRQRYSPRTDVPSEARQVIGRYIHDFALELGDQAPLRSTISRAVNLYEKSGLSLNDFIGYLYSARSQTKEYSGSIRKGRGDRSKGWQPASKVAYWFAVLEDQLGFREPTEKPAGAHPDHAESYQKPADRRESTRTSSSRSRRSIGGPLVRVVPLREEVDDEPASRRSTASSEQPAAAQKRLKSGRSASGEYPRASRES